MSETLLITLLSILGSGIIAVGGWNVLLQLEVVRRRGDSKLNENNIQHLTEQLQETKEELKEHWSIVNGLKEAINNINVTLGNINTTLEHLKEKE